MEQVTVLSLLEGIGWTDEVVDQIAGGLRRLGVRRPLCVNRRDFPILIVIMDAYDPRQIAPAIPQGVAYGCKVVDARLNPTMCAFFESLFDTGYARRSSCSPDS